MTTTNVEKKFMQALQDALAGQVIETESGFHQQLHAGNIFRADLPRNTVDTFNLVLEPKGPGFPLESLGRGGGMDARTKVVALDLILYYEHPEQSTMTDVLMDAAWWLSDWLIDQRGLGGATRISVHQGEYAWAKLDPDQENDNVTDSLSLGVFILPITAEYRRA